MSTGPETQDLFHKGLSVEQLLVLKLCSSLFESFIVHAQLLFDPCPVEAFCYHLRNFLGSQIFSCPDRLLYSLRVLSSAPADNLALLCGHQGFSGATACLRIRPIGP